MLGNMFRTCPSSRSISYILLRTVSSKPILTVQDGMIRDDHLVNGLWALATRSLEIGSSLNWNMNGRVWGLAGWFWATPSNLVWIIFSLWSSDHVPPTMYLFISNIRLNFEPRRRILFESSSASNSISPTRYPVKTTCGGIISGILIISPYYYHHSTINLISHFLHALSSSDHVSTDRRRRYISREFQSSSPSFTRIFFQCNSRVLGTLTWLLYRRTGRCGHAN